MVDNAIDLELASRLFSAWLPADGSQRAIRRPLQAGERALIEARALVLKASLAPYTDDERDDVEIAIGAMLGGFRSMRQEGDAAVAIVRVIAKVLEEFPPFAIERACLLIARRKTGFLNPPMSPEFPPNDCRIYEVAAYVVTPYRMAMSLAVALLSAPVEAREEERATRPALNALQARHGRHWGLGAPLPIGDAYG